MIEDLSGYNEQDISAAFLAWRRGSGKIPTPFDIIQLTEKASNKRAGVFVRWVDFSGSWEEYKKLIGGNNDS